MADRRYQKADYRCVLCRRLCFDFEVPVVVAEPCGSVVPDDIVSLVDPLVEPVAPPLLPLDVPLMVDPVEPDVEPLVPEPIVPDPDVPVPDWLAPMLD